MGARFAGWPVAGPIRPVPGVGCRGVCVGGATCMVFILDLHLPFCLALLYFHLLWLVKLSLPYLTPVAQYDSVAMLTRMSILLASEPPYGGCSTQF